MKFVALTSTDDGRLTKGRAYHGAIVHVGNFSGNHPSAIPKGLRIVVFDDKFEWMTFNPNAFRPTGAV